MEQHFPTRESREDEEDDDTRDDDDDDDDETDSEGNTSDEEEEGPTETVVNTEEERVEFEERKRQKAAIQNILRNEPKMKEGDTWYILSADWSKRWKDCVNYERTDDYIDLSRPRPGPINNTPLIVPDSDPPLTKKSLQEEYDYILICATVWETFISWYGGGPALPRKVITQGYANSLIVEIRPLNLRFVKSSDINTEVRRCFSKAESVGNMKQAMCEVMQLDPEKVRVWDYHGTSKLKLLTNSDQRLDEAQILDDQHILLEEKKEDGTWPESSRSFSSSYSYGGYYNSGPPAAPGLTGLTNLGNTCFMASALQCLSNTQPLTDFFLQNLYEKDINETNPLGSKGELASAYAELVKALWAGRHHAIAPREFKSKLERFAPQFVGYQQHDSQELLAYLLDGLHEDLNRVKQKPYREMNEEEGKSDRELAEEAWRNHLDRNNSIIVDWFQGQYKSTLVCPDCGKVSVTFDPFMYLSLPLPQITTRKITINFSYQDGKRNYQKFNVEVSKFGKILELKTALSALCGVPANQIFIADIYQGGFFKQFNDDERVESITERDVIFGFEITLPEEAGSIIHLPVQHVSSEGRYGSFAYPTILSVPAGLTYKQLRRIVVSYIEKYIKPEFLQLATSEEPAPDSPQIDMNSLSTTTEKSEVSQDGDSSVADDSNEKEEKEPKGCDKLFTLCKTDSARSYRYESLIDNDQPLDIKDRQPLAINWTSWAMQQAFNTDAERTFDLHSSVTDDESTEETGVSLYKCLELFTTVEKLGPDDPWYCNRCKEFRQATKKFDLWRLPRILVIHLKRFSYKNRYWREKLETLVDFPFYDLELSSHKINDDGVPALYDLFAVTNHYGSMGGGHYTAYAKSRDNKWYKFDDSSVSPMDEAHVKTSAAYVLFYRRKDSYDHPIVEPSAETPSVTEVAMGDSASTTTTEAAESSTNSEASSPALSTNGELATASEEMVLEDGQA